MYGLSLFVCISNLLATSIAAVGMQNRRQGDEENLDQGGFATVSPSDIISHFPSWVRATYRSAVQKRRSCPTAAYVIVESHAQATYERNAS